MSLPGPEYVQRMVKLCLTLAAGSAAEMQEKIRLYDGRVPLIEIRLDYLDPFSFPVIPAETDTRYLATCRPAREGGKYRGSEKDRLRILREAPGHRFSLVDLESDIEELPPFPDHIQIVRSSHDFRSCPQDLRQVFLEMKSLSGDLVKLVVTPQNTPDLVRLLEFMENNLPGSPGIILGMGPSAQVSRIIGPFLGSAWTYVSEERMGVAPGQFSLERAVGLYRLPERGCVPDLYGVAGRADETDRFSPGPAVRICHVSQCRSRAGADAPGALCPVELCAQSARKRGAPRRGR